MLGQDIYEQIPQKNETTEHLEFKRYVAPLCHNKRAMVYRSCCLLFSNDVSSIFNAESTVNQLADVFLDFIHDSIFDFEPQNIWIGFFEPIRLPADEDPCYTPDGLLCFFNLYFTLEHFNTFTISNRRHRWQGGGVTACQ